MYKYKIKVSIFSNDENMEKVVNAIKPLPNYEHEIKQYAAFDHTTFQLSDVVILDCDNIRYLNLEAFSDVKVILCTKKYSEKYKDFDSVIIKPFNYDYLSYEVKKVLKTIDLEDKYQFADNCLKTTINSMPDMFWIKSIDGIHTLLNDKFCEVVSKSKNDITGKDHYYIWNVSKDDPNSGADACKQSEDKVIAEGHTLSFNETVKSKNGMSQLVTYKTPLFDKKGKVIGTIGIGHDITGVKNLGIENQIMLNSFNYPILLRDEKGIIQNVNTAFADYFDIAKDDILDTNYETWASKVFATRTEADERGFKEGTAYIDNEEKEIELRFADILDVFNNVTGQVCSFIDITLERKVQKKLLQISMTDYLTGLYNRYYLKDFIDSIEDGEILTLFEFDLDHFKNVNDTYGHQKGDDALKLTADVLRNTFPNDLLVRMGGDEFLVVKVGEILEDEVVNLADKLLTNLLKNYKTDEQLLELGASIGVAQGKLKSHKLANILHRCDVALYAAKNGGRNRYIIAENEVKVKTKK